MGDKVAVVGTGIAGLSAAFLLSQEGRDVTVFEKHAEIGMDAHCLFVEDVDGGTMKINTPPRSFGPAYYPNLMELYRCSGVEIVPWSWAWVAFFVGSKNPFFRVERSARIFGFAIPSYLDLSSPLQMLRLLRDSWLFARSIRRDLFNSALCRLTLREYLAHIGVSEMYIYQVLLPTLSMVCTCSYDGCLNYPAGLVMEFYAKTTTYGQYRTRFGTEDAVAKLTKGVSRVVTSANVVAIQPKSSGDQRVSIRYSKSGGEIQEEHFSEVIVATQANHALEVLRGIPEPTRALLHTFKHERSRVVIHRDPVVMPQRREMWAPMSVAVLPHLCQSNGGASFTIWMNDSFPRIKGNLFQTWNPVVDIDSNLVVDKPIDFERPIMTLESLRSVYKLRKVQGTGGIWFCGAWNASRIPLQESGVMSALEVVRGILKRDVLVGNFQSFQIDQESFHLEKEHHKVVESKDLYQTTNVLSLFLPNTRLGFVGAGVFASFAVAMCFRLQRVLL